MSKKISEILNDPNLVSITNYMQNFDSICYTLENYPKPKLEDIDLNQLVGTFKDSYLTNTLGMIANTQFFQTVPYNNKTELSNMLNDQNRSDLPMVAEYKNKYYISGDGNHRLISGKLLGVKTAKALVTYLDDIDGEKVEQLISEKKY